MAFGILNLKTVTFDCLEHYPDKKQYQRAVRNNKCYVELEENDTVRKLWSWG